jgi:hypothetical protein
VVFRSRLAPLSNSPALIDAFQRANAIYYQGVDWALDISEAEFSEVDLEGIPGHLIRRDPRTQVRVTRAKALEGRWRTVNLSGTYWAILLEEFANDGSAQSSDTVVLAAPKLARNFRTHLGALDTLRAEGIAESD